MNKLEIDVLTGEKSFAPLSTEEIEAIAIAEQERLASITYVDQRRAEYPSFEEQMDLLYHAGYSGWKATITAIKEKYPIQ